MFLWECMIIGFKAILGIFAWMFILLVLGILFASIAYAFRGKSNIDIKPKYEGQEIVINGHFKDVIKNKLNGEQKNE